MSTEVLKLDSEIHISRCALVNWYCDIVSIMIQEYFFEARVFDILVINLVNGNDQDFFEMAILIAETELWKNKLSRRGCVVIISLNILMIAEVA